MSRLRRWWCRWFYGGHDARPDWIGYRCRRCGTQYP